MQKTLLGEEISCTRFNDGLDLTGTEWGYDNLYVSNAGGADKGIDIGSGLSFNPSTMDGKLLKEMVKSQLFKIRFPSEKEMEYQVTIAGNIYTQEIPMSVEGNKVTFHMENVYSNLKNIEVYMFQNMKGSQMHLNMTRDAFVDFIANMYAINVKDSSAAQAKREELNTALTSFNMAMIFEREQ